MYALPIVKSQVIDDTLILDFNGILYPLSNVTRSGFQDTMIPNGGDVLYYLTSDCSGIDYRDAPNLDPFPNAVGYSRIFVVAKKLSVVDITQLSDTLTFNSSYATSGGSCYTMQYGYGPMTGRYSYPTTTIVLVTDLST